MSEKIIDITEKAAVEIKNIMNRKDIPANYGLRVGIKRGSGCIGVTFFVGFDIKKTGDEEISIYDIPIYIEKQQLMFIIGQQIDYIERKNEMGFVFKNNSEKKTPKG